MPRMIRLASALIAAAALSALAAPGALAAVSAQSAAGESNLGYLLAGTLLTWAGFFVYAVYVARKNSALRREVEELRAALAERDDGE